MKDTSNYTVIRKEVRIIPKNKKRTKPITIEEIEQKIIAMGGHPTTPEEEAMMKKQGRWGMPED